MKTKKSDVNDRRSFLKLSGAALAAASIPTVATGAPTGAQKGDDGQSPDRSSPIYLHGCGWNRALPGVFGQVCLAFDIRAELGGTGVGTLRDDVYPEVNSQIQINSATKHGDEYTLDGEIITSRDPANIGRPVTIVAQSIGDGKGSAVITIGTVASSPNLVVNAIIAVLNSVAILALAEAPRRRMMMRDWSASPWQLPGSSSEKVCAPRWSIAVRARSNYKPRLSILTG